MTDWLKAVKVSLIIREGTRKTKFGFFRPVLSYLIMYYLYQRDKKKHNR